MTNHLGLNFFVLTAILFALAMAQPGKAAAGLSGENLIVVVNADSLASRTVANHYVKLRDIPAGNIIFLSDIPDGLTIDLDGFREKILKPILATIEKRGLATQARCVAYSADFPTSVDIASYQANPPPGMSSKLVGRLGSVTGLTYLYQFVLADSEKLVALGTNNYARTNFARTFINPFSNDDAPKFDAAKAQLDNDEPLAAAEGFQELHTKYPSVAPLAILSARGYAKAKRPTDATKMIKLAIRSGWWSAEYLRDDEELSPLLDDSGLKTVLAAMPSRPVHVQGPLGFSAIKGWTRCGYPVRLNQGSIGYMMACSLAVIHERGNNLRQSVAVLHRAVQSDRTFPDGIFQFAGNSDVRAKTRFLGVGDALLYLESINRETNVFRKIFPSTSGNFAGLFLGTANVDFPGVKWRLQPGAIAETLTSTAGDFSHPHQTKLTEYLKAGAAISSGTVTEPYSLQPKFPLAMMHGYYASGCTAIESYYLSLLGPYQLLIAGDPACQPFAKPPADDVTIDLKSGDNPLIHFTRTPSEGATPTASWEIFLEGRLTKVLPGSRAINMNLKDELSGVIEIRASLVGFDPSEPRLTKTKWIEMGGGLAAPVASIAEPVNFNATDPTSFGDDGSDRAAISVKLDCPGADRIRLTHQSEILATMEGESGTVNVELSELGGGPIRLRPIALFGEKGVGGRPLEL